MSGWPERTLGELCALVTDGKHGDCEPQPGSGYYFLSCKDVRDGQLNYDGSREITHEDFIDTHRRTRLAPGDILITNSGTIGRMAIVPDNNLTEKTTFQKSVAILKPKHDVVSSPWLYYSMLSNIEALISFAGGTAQKNLLLRDLRSFSVKLPPFETQRRIASILGAYDELIEVNRRRIKLLEEMARGLFEEWFVRFRFPGHETVPLLDTPNGSLPQGWEHRELGTLLELAYGKALKATDRQPGPYPVIGSSGVIGMNVACLEKGPGIIVGRKGNVGSIIWTPHDYWPIDTVYFVKSPTPLLFLLQLLRRVPFQNTDAAVPGLNRNAALKKIVVVPPSDLTEQFAGRVSSMQDMVDGLVVTNERLAASRDLLLPRLISGQLSIEAAEQMPLAAE